MSYQIGSLDIGVAFAGDVSGLQQATSGAGGAVDGFSKKATTSLKDVQNESKRTEDSMARLANGIKGAFIGGSVAVGLIKLKNTLMETSTAVIDAQVQLDKWSNGFKFGAGGMAAGAREMAFVREEAQRLGLELAGASTQYMKLVAASRGTAMEGEKTRNVFTAVSEAATVMGMSGEQSERAFMAITQMMSKGKVQAEELRGQLGEHLPGAFAIAARSMGVTEAELNKLMETGQIMSADFLPKFGAQLRKELAGSVEDASKSMQASLNRAETAWLMFKQNVAQSGVSSFISQIINAASSDLAAMSTAMESARLAGKGFAGQMNDVAGLVIARSSIGAIEVAAESLNWTINALTGNVLGLSENIDLMPNSLKSAAQQSDALGQRLMDAEARLATLQERFKTSPDSPYFLVEIAQAKLLIEQLKRANQEKAQLIGENYGTESKREESRKGDIRLQDDRLAAYKSLMATLATPQEKFNTELAKQKELLGNLFTADVEARLRAHYIKPVREAAEQTDTLTAARKRELEVVELRNKTVGEAAKAEADYQAAFDARNFDAAWDADQKHLAAVEERIKAGRTALEQLQFENSLLAMNTTEREVATAMRELERQGVVRGTEAWDAYADAIKSAVVDREAAKQATDFWQSIETTAKGVWTDVANGGVSAFERIGKTLKASVLDVLWQMTGRQWLVSVGISLGIPGAAMAGQQSAGAFSPLQGMGGLDALYKSVTQGVSASVTAGFESLVTNGVGEKLGLSYYNGTGYSTTGLGAQLGQYAGMAGNAMAGYGLQKAISGGYKTGESGLVDAATVVASAIMGPLAGVVGGVVNRAFGRKFTGSGVEGEFGGAAGFVGNSYADYKGGWFRSDKTVRSELDPALAAGLAEGYELLETSVGDMSKALGLSAKGLETYTRKIRFSTNGLSQDQVAQKLQEEFAALGDEMAQLVLGTYAYTRAGESSSAALSRLSTSLVTVNATFDVLGRTLYSADLIGADMASQLADAFGGLADVASASQAYFAAYYTDAEKAATSTRLLTDKFADLGFTLPASKEQFRALVDSLDLTTEGGRKTYAELLKLAPEFDNTAKLIEAVAKANAQKLVKSYTGWGGVVRALDGVGLSARLLASDAADADKASSSLGSTLSGKTTSLDAMLAEVKGDASSLGSTLSGKTTSLDAMLAEVKGDASALGGTLSGKTTSLDAKAADAATAVGTINKNLGDASSGVYTLGGDISDSLGTLALSPAQQAVADLYDEIDTLKSKTTPTVTELGNLWTALEKLDTSTFTQALSLVFEQIAQQLQGTLDTITNERVAVREAAISVIDPKVYSYTLLKSQIANQNVALPSAANLTNANDALVKAAANKDKTDATLAAAGKTLDAAQEKFSKTKADIVKAEAAENAAFAKLGFAFGGGFTIDAAGKPVWSSTEMNGQIWWGTGGWDQINAVQAMRGDTTTAWYNYFQKGAALPSKQDPNAPWNLLDTLSKTYHTDLSAVKAAQSAFDKADASATKNNDALTAAEKKQRDEAAKYATALTNYAAASATATANLGRLREETAKYYQQQKDLAELMSKSAAGLRTSVADYRFSKLTVDAQYKQRQSEYDKAYSLALSTTGEAQAGYADQMNALLPQLLELAEATDNTKTIATTLARAEAVAGKLEDTLPKNYQAESLELLGNIDSTLAALGDGTQILVRAIDAGRDKTAEGLRAVIAALTGKTVPAFADGGYYPGGLALVGERGPELINFANPGQVYTADQTAKLLATPVVQPWAGGYGGGTMQAVFDRMAQQMDSMAREIAALRAESRQGDAAIASNTGKLARYADRWDGEGLPVRNADDTKLEVEAV